MSNKTWLVVVVAGLAALALWMRYDERHVEIRVVNKSTSILYELRVQIAGEEHRHGGLAPAEEWHPFFHPGAPSDIDMSYTDGEGRNCARPLALQIETGVKGHVEVLVNSCTEWEVYPHLGPF